MAAANGSAPQPLAADHLAYLSDAAPEAQRYEVFALLRAAEARAPDLPRIGRSRLPAQDVASLTQAPILAFPGPTLESITVHNGRAEVRGYYLGLTGPMGPLPLHLSEFAFYERKYARKRPFGRMLDLLAGRMLQLFYRAWADSQPAASADRPADDRFALHLGLLSGAVDGARADSAFPARARLHYAGLFASRRSAAGIQDGLSHLLRTPVRLTEFEPRWREIDRADRTQLGRGFTTLGRDAVIGSKVLGVTDAFRVTVKADTFRDYEELLPTGARFAIAAEALDAFSPSHLEWTLELEIDERRARSARLDGRSRLGWTSWVALQGRGGLRADTRLGRSSRPRDRGRGAPGSGAGQTGGLHHG